MEQSLIRSRSLRYKKWGLFVGRVLAFAMLWLLFTTSAPSSSGSEGHDKLEALAAMGWIQEDAPVKAASEITIKAPRETIWQILTNINDWPSNPLFRLHV